MKTHAMIGIGSVAALAALLLSGCIIRTNSFKAGFSRSENLIAPLTDITALDISTNVGKIHLEAADVPEVRIAAEIKVRARTEEMAQALAEQVRIVAEPSGRTLTIKAVKPPDFGRNELSVDFTVIAPAALALTCTTNVGSIRVTDFTRPVKATTDVGTIQCTGLREAVDLHTNVGDIRARYAPEAPAAIKATMATNVGSIEFTGPQEISAQVTAAANVGDIHTERPITTTGSIKKSLHGSLGRGEGQVNLRTNVGSIRIR